MQNSFSSFNRTLAAVSLFVAATLPYTAQAQTCSGQSSGPGCAIASSAAVAKPPAVARATAAPAAPRTRWVAPRDASLRELLSQWSAQAGWQEPTWTLKPEEDFTLGASMEYEGDISGAVGALFDAFPAEAGLRVRMFSTNRLMIVEQAP